MVRMENSDLKMQVGESLQLQPRDDDTRRMHVKLIGYLTGVSLLVTTPRTGDKVMIIREGQPFVVRMMVGNRIVGFATTVTRVCSRPFPYLHLSYPEDMEQITVRKAQRVRVKLMAFVKNANPAFHSEKGRPATVVDISTSGALLVAGEQLGELDDQVTMSCALKVGGAEKLLPLSAVIRNVHVEPVEGEAGQSYYHGLEFDLTKQPDTFALHGFVYEQIVKAQSE